MLAPKAAKFSPRQVDAAAAASDEDGLASIEVFREVLGYQHGFPLCLVVSARITPAPAFPRRRSRPDDGPRAYD
jgi:hypothetical protein